MGAACKLVKQCSSPIYLIELPSPAVEIHSISLHSLWKTTNLPMFKILGQSVPDSGVVCSCTWLCCKKLVFLFNKAKVERVLGDGRATLSGHGWWFKMYGATINH
ncbi:hypothetical protein TSUD_221630 [Trifolium subterraneum]|uniref:Uncharacterized protein n=1 Tax=Trifolium subterraneum TaxID=3900 RepID=A0A2Z6ND34_TRISU|nr:hypothetical protein TSUD_221630 [Trifolium subterraneum]